MTFQHEPLGDEYIFQTFLKDLFNAIYDTQTFEEYGSKGNKQYGVDLYSPTLKIAVQAKKKDIHRNHKILIKELLTDLSETMANLEDFPHLVTHLFFATTTKKHIEIQKACIDASTKHELSITFFSWHDIQEKLYDCPIIRNKYYPHLKESSKATDVYLNEQISKLEILIEKLELEKQNPQIKKTYRSIPNCDIILPNLDHEPRKILIATIIKLALYQTFKDVKYKKFGGLLHFDNSYTEFSDGTSGPGFKIISGEVVFLANCSKLIISLQDNPSDFWNQIDHYKDDECLKKIRFRMELLPRDGLTAYEFEIDNQIDNYRMTIQEYQRVKL